MRAPVIDGDHIYMGTNNDHGYLPQYPKHIDPGFGCVSRNQLASFCGSISTKNYRPVESTRVAQPVWLGR
ncbi:MAG TPA: hypothetical protein DD473_22060 [Planctomycetaceae bacterium]|nr:hypothetical protein [Planctomycetaceae bacterium]